MRAAKAYVAAAGSFVTVLTAALADDVLSADETGSLLASLITAVGTVVAVYKIPNAGANGGGRGY